MLILFSTKCFLSVFMYTNILKRKAYKLFGKKVMVTSPGLLFKEANLFTFRPVFNTWPVHRLHAS